MVRYSGSHSTIFRIWLLGWHLISIRGRFFFNVDKSCLFTSILQNVKRLPWLVFVKIGTSIKIIILMYHFLSSTKKKKVQTLLIHSFLFAVNKGTETIYFTHRFSTSNSGTDQPHSCEFVVYCQSANRRRSYHRFTLLLPNLCINIYLGRDNHVGEEVGKIGNCIHLRFFPIGSVSVNPSHRRFEPASREQTNEWTPAYARKIPDCLFYELNLLQNRGSFRSPHFP